MARVWYLCNWCGIWLVAKQALGVENSEAGQTPGLICAKRL